MLFTTLILSSRTPGSNLTVVNVAYLLITCPYFDNLYFDIFHAGGPQWHFYHSVSLYLYCVVEDFHMSTDNSVQKF